MADGSITIDILANQDKFDRQIAKLEKKIEDTEKEKLEIDTEIKNIKEQENQFEEARQKARQYKAELERLKQVQESFPSIVRDETSNVKSLEYEKVAQDIRQTSALLQEQNKIILNSTSTLGKQGSNYEKLLSKQQQLNDKVSEYKQKIENVKLEQQVAEVDRMKQSFNNVGSSIQNAISRVSRLALGIFGIRSAYMALRRASSDLASYDKQYAVNLEYIRYALTQMIAPVLKYIVNLAATLLGYINAIMQGWFGINLFSRGSVDNFKKMKAGASGVSKAVAEIKKQLAGFDEINILTDQSDTGTSAGAGGVGIPSFDLSEMQGEVPEWLQWIIDHKDEILSTLAGIASGLAFLKLGEIARSLGLIKGNMLGIKAIGFGVLIKGIIDLVSSLKDYLEDDSWENFGKVIKSIGEIVLGLGLLIGNVPLIVAGAIILIIGLIIKHWEEIKSFFQKGIDWLANKSDWVYEMFGDTIGNIYDTFVKNLQLILNWFDMTFKNIKQILDGVIEFLKGVFTGNWEQALNGLKKIFQATLDWIKNTAITVFQIIWNNIKNIFSNIGNFFSNIINTIINKFKDIGTKAGEVVSGAFKTVVNNVLRAIETILNSPIRAINNLIGIINAVPGINLNKLNTFNLPRLKTGAIINMPNRGTLVGGGSAIAGEAGREGILPLDDRTAMAQLGEEIGKHVLVNLTNITQMNGRVIGRELKQIQSEQNFAYNL